MCDEQRSSSEEVLKALVENHRAFLAFVERRVGTRDVAEEILQAAFVGWFYRVVRNAIVDDHRRQTVADKRFAAYVREATLDLAGVMDRQGWRRRHQRHHDDVPPASLARITGRARRPRADA